MTDDTHNISCADTRENARSKVRRVVTYCAAGYVFGGAGLLIIASFIPGLSANMMEVARTAYMLAAPIGGMAIGWWFAKRDEERTGV